MNNNKSPIPLKDEKPYPGKIIRADVVNPMPHQAEVTELMDFLRAIVMLREGKSVRRASWDESPDSQILIRKMKLQIHNEKGFHDWIVSEEDLEATDWIVI